MLTDTETKILKLLMQDLTKQYTIREISLVLDLKYPQAHRSVMTLLKKALITKIVQGKSSIISLDFKNFHEEYVCIELERKKDILKVYLALRLLGEDLVNLSYSQFVCILFGSYAEKKTKKDSDIDLLFVIPDEFDYGKFEKSIKTSLNIPRVDINITTEQGLIEMWNTPAKLNVGNELLKKHIIFRGAEQFLYLMRRHYVG